ncbi:MAG: type II CAAX prenyl endopeptidase Rce1 family protein [Candidatus Hydrothermarchaeaceae archaeon]
MFAVLISLALLLISRIWTPTVLPWITEDVLLFILAPLFYIAAFKRRPSEFGLKAEPWVALRYALVMLALGAPFILYGATLEEFRAYYPIWKPAEARFGNLLLLWAWLLVTMFATEFFFRGFLLFDLERHFGWAAVPLHAVPYALVHIGKPWLEVPYSFLVGLVFGYVALRTRSILPSYIAHWSAAVIFDALTLVR